ncbi:MAG: FHA domain-containing protein [Nocardioides sp.]|nr:FHA domain-containing protein [Nocardioides sp.]
MSHWRVTFDTGEELEVQGLVLVGRRPEPRPGEPVGTLLALTSSDMSLSKTHAQFQVVPDGALVVMDRGSTNGSVLVRGGLYKPLEGGRPATLKHGDRVRFGDREMTVARLDPPAQ